MISAESCYYDPECSNYCRPPQGSGYCWGFNNSLRTNGSNGEIITMSFDADSECPENPYIPYSGLGRAFTQWYSFNWRQYPVTRKWKFLANNRAMRGIFLTFYYFEWYADVTTDYIQIEAGNQLFKISSDINYTRLTYRVESYSNNGILSESGSVPSNKVFFFDVPYINISYYSGKTGASTLSPIVLWCFSGN
jgi:hypothetical protein